MLHPNTVFRKTEAGVTEVQARVLGLRAELRRLLILIDGKMPVGRLAGIVRGTEIDFLIAELETQGLITSLAGAPPPIASSQGSSDPGGGGEPTAEQFQAARRAAVRTLNDLLGPSAETLAVKVERCKTAAEFRVAVTEVRQTLDRLLGAASGQRFLDAIRNAVQP